MVSTVSFMKSLFYEFFIGNFIKATTTNSDGQNSDDDDDRLLILNCHEYPTKAIKKIKIKSISSTSKQLKDKRSKCQINLSALKIMNDSKVKSIDKDKGMRYT